MDMQPFGGIEKHIVQTQIRGCLMQLYQKASSDNC